MSGVAPKPLKLEQQDWDNFIRAVMPLNADEAMLLACALDDPSLFTQIRRTFRGKAYFPAVNLPVRLFDYACLQSPVDSMPDVDEDMIKPLVQQVTKLVKLEKDAREILGVDLNPHIDGKIDSNKVKQALRHILSTPLNVINACTMRLAERIEFQAAKMIGTMPVTSDKIFELAYTDAEEGSERGLAWACFQLRRVFGDSVEQNLDEDAALDLFGDLQGIPDLTMDLYGEAGMDVAIRMEKMLGKVGAMSTLRATGIYPEMRPHA